MKLKPIFLAVAFGVLGGCNMAPKTAHPALPVPEMLSVQGGNSGTSAINPAELDWEQHFTEPRLRDVMQLALDNNRDLRAALANVAQARALYRVQRSDLFPMLGVDGRASYEDLPGGVPPGAGGTTSGGGRNDIYTAGIGVSAWEIDLFGRIRNLGDAALEQYLTSVENRNAVQVALIAEVATAWLTLAADQEQLRIALDSKRAFDQTLALTRTRLAAGVASELDVRQAQTSFDQARADIAEGITRVDRARNALNLLAGTTIGTELLPESLPDTGATLAMLSQNLPSETLLRRPDIAAAEHQLRAANANIGAARAAYFPTLSLTAAFGTMSPDFSGLFDSGSDYWSVAPAISVPIFDFGRNRANLRYSEATYDAMLARYERAIQTGFREVADAMARRRTIDVQLDALTSLHDAARGAYRLSEERFLAGIDSFLTTLDSQRTLYNAERSLLTARATREANAVELYRALGGGFGSMYQAGDPAPDRADLPRGTEEISGLKGGIDADDRDTPVVAGHLRTL